jgi:protein tyrosine phosphatase (PTP) superfamily phosphohydrolase (DUF442 family)
MSTGRRRRQGGGRQKEGTMVCGPVSPPTKLRYREGRIVKIVKLAKQPDSRRGWWSTYDMSRRTIAQWLGMVALMVAQNSSAQTPSRVLELEDVKLGATRNVHAFGPTLLCGQPNAEALAMAKQQGIQTILSLRAEDELDWDEKAEAEKLGMTFERVWFQGADTLTDEVFQRTREILRTAETKRQPVLMHCGGGNRVGAIWMVYRSLDQGISPEDAEKEAREVGLRSDDYVVKARDYIKRNQ